MYRFSLDLWPHLGFSGFGLTVVAQLRLHLFSFVARVLGENRGVILERCVNAEVDSLLFQVILNFLHLLSDEGAFNLFSREQFLLLGEGLGVFPGVVSSALRVGSDCVGGVSS